MQDERGGMRCVMEEGREGGYDGRLREEKRVQNWKEREGAGLFRVIRVVGICSSQPTLPQIPYSSIVSAVSVYTGAVPTSRTITARSDAVHSEVRTKPGPRFSLRSALDADALRPIGDGWYRGRERQLTVG